MAALIYIVTFALPTYHLIRLQVSNFPLDLEEYCLKLYLVLILTNRLRVYALVKVYSNIDRGGLSFKAD